MLIDWEKKSILTGLVTATIQWLETVLTVALTDLFALCKLIKKLTSTE